MSASPERARHDGPPVQDIIEAGGDDLSDDTFQPSEWDASSSGSTSITSSNGRRYHSFRDGRYPIPNDDIEQNRKDMKHAMVMELTDGKLFHAPIGDSPSKIIDLGTGTGKLPSRHFGDRFPSADVTGGDLSPIQPSWVPSNVRLFVDDVEDDWLARNNFNLIHMRKLASPLHDLPKLLERVFDNLKPGAFIETQDFSANVQCDDGTMPEDWPLLEFWSKIRDAMHKMKIDIQVAPRIGALMRDAGFVNVEAKSYKVPVGRWPLDKTKRLVGHYMRSVTEDFLGMAASKPLAALGMDRTEIEVFLASVRNAIKDPEVHAYGTYYSLVGQKPVGSGHE
ncbi:S-adenosyl-L-methionine-dependent methyltransferase [Colletotrichum godetiae]|uniref:S-adenosyl-L-methionine-dependent methyltransferase n=1 Tax=Colletotrichum godetiae TaxID=1209918 RepID=A0AAJ0AHI9_9PEZI|nr:S-adenosyl-L-methionine-dependent methyltransferase [Colletotrichum godetiae]KAK1673400.1 S-adenosyl-L-methionine-dependent methyltransferase [Colletotrichum godetiae]